MDSFDILCFNTFIITFGIFYTIIFSICIYMFIKKIVKCIGRHKL